MSLHLGGGWTYRITSRRNQMTKLEELKDTLKNDEAALALVKARGGWYAEEDDAYFKVRASYDTYQAELKKQQEQQLP
jgi:hypothetical protein